jgi:hypothetical protein
MTTKRRISVPQKMVHIPYPRKRCPDCDYCVDAAEYYGEKTPGRWVCIDERRLDGYNNPMCGCAVDAGFGCVRWETT